MSGFLADSHADQVRGFFDRQSRTWSSQYDSALISDRVERFLTVLRSAVPAHGAVLDLGCGSGDITVAAAAQGWRVTGCDISPGMIAVASVRPGARAVSWVKLSDTSQPLPFGTASFDAVYSSSVLEYVSDIADHLTEVARVLSPGGIYLATVPDMRNPVRLAEQSKRRIAGSRLLLAMVRLTRWGPQYEYLRASINRWEIDRWLALLRAARLSPNPPPACEDPLALLVARKL